MAHHVCCTCVGSCDDDFNGAATAMCEQDGEDWCENKDSDSGSDVCDLLVYSKHRRRSGGDYRVMD